MKENLGNSSLKSGHFSGMKNSLLADYWKKKSHGVIANSRMRGGKPLFRLGKAISGTSKTISEHFDTFPMPNKSF